MEAVKGSNIRTIRMGCVARYELFGGVLSIPTYLCCDFSSFGRYWDMAMVIRGVRVVCRQRMCRSTRRIGFWEMGHPAIISQM